MGTTASSKDMLKRQIEGYQKIIEDYKKEIAYTRELMKNPHNKNNVPDYKRKIEYRQKEIKQYQDLIKGLRERMKGMK